MKSRSQEILLVFFLIVTGIYFLLHGLISAQSFLAPLSIAILLSMILTPLSRILERWNLSRGWSSFLCVLLTFIFFIGLFFIISLQVKNISRDWPEIEKNLQPKIEQLQQYIAGITGLTPLEQTQMIQEKIPGNSTDGENPDPSPNQKTSEQANKDLQESISLKKSLGAMLLKFLGFMGTSLLTFIYIFFFLLYRNKIKKSILRFFSAKRQQRAREILHESINVSQNYLVGRLLLILLLAIQYTAGLWISGVKHAVLASIIAAFLSLIPYVGNMIGFFLAMALAAFSGGHTMMFVGVIITFSVIQFIDTYIFEPYLLGSKVDLNPLITIIVVIMGGAIWGVVGMIISIPVFGILKIVFDRINVLQPLGYTLGEEDIHTNGKDSIMEKTAKKIKGRFKKK